VEQARLNALQVFKVGGWSFGALRSLDVLPGNLPLLASSFVGREAEMAAVAKALGVSGLVTLTGVGGVGKTRLALQVVAEMAPAFVDGAWICELAAAATGDDMAQVVASALGVVQRQQMSLAESIVDFLRTRQMLVVLDNCEHLLDPAAGLVEMVLAAAGGVRVLATSREGLGIPAEHMQPLRSDSQPMRCVRVAAPNSPRRWVVSAMSAKGSVVRTGGRRVRGQDCGDAWRAARRGSRSIGGTVLADSIRPGWPSTPRPGK
jgi:hypothetical protein